MSVASDAPPRAPREPARTGVGRRMRVGTVLAVACVLLAAVVLRFVTRSDLWFDEALTVNIARLPIGDLRGALEHDGAPPLYYAMLHVWIDAFGSGDVAVRALSGVCSLGALVAMYFAGRRIGGPWVGWASVLVLATSPFAIRYATEARMYSLVVLLVLLGYLALRRALERPSVGRLAQVALVGALLLYAQYWSIYLLAVVGAGLVARAVRAGDPDDRRAARRLVGALVASGLAFVPWLPTFRSQLANTGTPWAAPRLPWAGAAEALFSFAGTIRHGEAYPLLLPLVVLPLLGVFGAAVDARHVDLDLRTRPAVRWEAAAAAATLVLGLCVSYVGDSAFEGRYASVIFPLAVLVLAYGLTVFADRRVRAAALAVVVLLGLAGGVRNVVERRTQAYQVADVIAAQARPGDVVAYCPDQVGPDVSRLLEGERGLRQLTFPDGARPERVDWVDYVARTRAADPAEFARRAIARAAPGGAVWLVWAGGYHNLEGRCEAVLAAFEAQRPGGQVRVVPDDGFYEYQGLTRYAPR